jgi:hypothetical protein
MLTFFVDQNVIAMVWFTGNVLAADNPHDAWHQPLLRLMDTLIGIAIGVACKWILSSCSHGSAGEGA